MKSIGREILWNLPRGTATIVDFLGWIVGAVLAWGVFLRLKAYRRGRPERENRLDGLRGRARDACRIIIGHGKVPRESSGGLVHIAIVTGFVALVVVTSLVAVECDLGWAILDGGFYIAFKLFAETSGLLLLLGACAALVRRYAVRPNALATRGTDLFPLIAIGAVVLTGFLVESVRLAATAPAAGRFSYASRAIAGLYSGMPLPDLLRLHRILWWTHLALAFAFLAAIPYGKMIHLIAAPANIFLKTSRPPGSLQPIPDFGTGGHAGAGTIEELSWKQLLDLDACVQCGRCEEHCPAHLTGKTLSPQKLIRDLRAHFRERTATCGREPAPAPMIDGGGVGRSDLWACTTCARCTGICPVMVEHVEKVVDMRRHLVLGKGVFPEELEQMFRKLETYSDPWGMGAPRRMEWAAGLGLEEMKGERRPDLLYWVGCAGAFDERARRVAVSMATILAASGVDFGILGASEYCCGDFARRGGNEYLFHRLAKRNLEVLGASGARKIVTSCPHCYNALRNEYPSLGGRLDVLHHSEWILEMLEGRRIRLSKPLEKRVVYHDSCYLGRYNGIYDPPRDLLRRIQGLTPVEAGRHREAGFCCGAGGGFLWLEERGQRINADRTNEMLDLSPDIVAAACPHCLSMFEDGLSAAAREGAVPEALDLAEIVARSL